ncbi:hypothetical protein J3U01_09515 [Bifidobacterium sp. B4107]|uniref:hypothetical protein n=1 Tax=unclassified Bifidobacterium TaxID=2608897 RepID=UPI00226B8933|nr:MULTISPECIES: hypothetical protein [unclassified Bifidobacterium]MCX8648638.1 hypothetical protein [Bifidobacterium sp. B4107]MCX8652836.1 hypothetical protein [Bifidobacterium sp. B4111]MCX8659265.1 hypothetical protein [Bifidobacterium sp. B4114]
MNAATQSVLALAISPKRLEPYEQEAQTHPKVSAADKAGRASNRLKGIDRYYAKAGKAVLASRDAKSLEDAKTALNAKKDEASKLLSDSDGKVADNALRDSLQQAISQAGSIKDNKTETYQDAATALQSAIDQVNTSIQQKSQAAPPAQAAASAARQPAQRSTPAQQRPAFLLVGDGKATRPPAGPHTTMAAAPRQPPQHPRLHLLRQQHRKAAAQTGETD